MEKSKEIQSYLPLYLGQKVQTPFRTYPPNGGKSYKLCGLVMDIDLVINQVGVWFEGEQKEDLVNYPFDEVKLILRPLSSMTEEEAKVVTEIATRFNNRAEWRTDKVIPLGPSVVIIQAYHKTVSEKFGTQEYVEYIHLSDGIWVNDLHRELQHHTNGFEVTQFLLSKGFDIFGLHEKGLCLYPEEVQL